MMNTKNYTKQSLYVVLLFIAFTLISYFYTLATGDYNGDFLGKKSNLNEFELFYSAIFTIIPFVILYYIYLFFSKRSPQKKIHVQLKPFGIFLIFLSIFQIYTTVEYGVGRLFREIYQAPFYIKPFIQVFSRFNIMLGTFIYISCVKKIDLTQILLLILCLIHCITRTSLMGFIIISLFLYIKYSGIINSFAKKHILLGIILLTSLPFVISNLYDLRDSMRNSSEVNMSRSMTTTELIIGKFVGRLSSYPSTTMIMERKEIIKDILKKHDINEYQYLKEAASAFYGKIIENQFRYMNTLAESQGVDSRIWSMMNGTQGSLMIAAYSSAKAFFITLATILIMISLTFYISTHIQGDGILESVLVFFLISGMSGVAIEYSAILMSLLLYFLFFLLLNLISSKKL